MYALTLAGQVLVIFIMGAVSYWGSKKIDPETRVRSRTVGLDWTMRSRKTALLAPPLIGVFVPLGTLLVNDSPSRAMGAALGLAVLVFMVLAHWSTVKRAAGNERERAHR